MKFDISDIEFNKFDIKRKVKIPDRMTKELAYFLGIHVGDGCLKSYKRKTCDTIDYNLEYYGHEVDEKEFHRTCITPLIKKLFNIDVWVYVGNKTTIKTNFRSKAVFHFLKDVIGLPEGPKKNIDVPLCIKNSDIEIKKSFLRGFADTEGCISFKRKYKLRNYYPTISLGGKSKGLVKTIESFLHELGIVTCPTYGIEGHRNGKINIMNNLDINGTKGLNRWMQKIGFNSSKHLTKYWIWRKFGFCPPDTNFVERRKILKGEIDINSYYGPVAQPG